MPRIDRDILKIEDVEVKNLFSYKQGRLVEAISGFNNIGDASQLRKTEKFLFGHAFAISRSESHNPGALTEFLKPLTSGATQGFIFAEDKDNKICGEIETQAGRAAVEFNPSTHELTISRTSENKLIPLTKDGQDFPVFAETISALTMYLAQTGKLGDDIAETYDKMLAAIDKKDTNNFLKASNEYFDKIYKEVFQDAEDGKGNFFNLNKIKTIEGTATSEYSVREFSDPWGSLNPQIYKDKNASLNPNRELDRYSYYNLIQQFNRNPNRTEEDMKKDAKILEAKGWDQMGNRDIDGIPLLVNMLFNISQQLDERAVLLEKGSESIPVPTCVLVGAPGVGKTTAAEIISTILGTGEATVVSCNQDMTTQDVLVSTELVDGGANTSYKESAFVKAIESGHIGVLDEADKAPKNLFTVLNDLSSSGRITIPTDNGSRTITADKDFVLIYTLNELNLAPSTQSRAGNNIYIFEILSGDELVKRLQMSPTFDADCQLYCDNFKIKDVQKEKIQILSHIKHLAQAVDDYNNLVIESLSSSAHDKASAVPIDSRAFNQCVQYAFVNAIDHNSFKDSLFFQATDPYRGTIVTKHRTDLLTDNGIEDFVDKVKEYLQ